MEHISYAAVYGHICSIHENLTGPEPNSLILGWRVLSSLYCFEQIFIFLFYWCFSIISRADIIPFTWWNSRLHNKFISLYSHEVRKHIYCIQIVYACHSEKVSSCSSLLKKFGWCSLLILPYVDTIPFLAKKLHNFW